MAAGGGVIVKRLGDGMVCQFGSAEAAFRAACQMQTTACVLPPGGQPRLAIKIGFTYGPVIADGSDVFGDTVNVCARLAAIAKAGQIVTTQQAVDALAPGARARCRQLYSTKVRGRLEEVTVFDVLWRSDPDLTNTDFPRPGAFQSGEWVLKISYGGEVFVIERNRPARLGRDRSTDIVVFGELVSRVHARVFERDGNFLIADESSNGTYVLPDGNGREVLLRRQETVLADRGWIGLGKSAATHGDHVLRFRLERQAR